MSKKKKFPRGKSVPLATFLTQLENPSSNTRSSNHKSATPAPITNQNTTNGAELIKLVNEEHAHRLKISAVAKKTREHFEDNMYEKGIEQEWREYRQEGNQDKQAQQENSKKAEMAQFHTQQILTRSNIAEKETEQRITLSNLFFNQTNNSKVDSDTKDGTMNANTPTKTETAKTPGMFQPSEAASSASTIPEAKKEQTTTQASGWFSGWFGS